MAVDPVLVVMFLRGGADGLGLVCTASDPDLIAARPEDLRVLRKGDAKGRLIRQDIAEAEFRFHPGLAELADLYEAGDLTLIHAAGLTEATRSHFDAEAQIERAVLGSHLPPGDPSGWLGRWLATAKPGGPMPALAVGARRPDSLTGADTAVAGALADLMVAPGHWLSQAFAARLGTGFGSHAALDRPMQDLLALSQMLGARLWSDTDHAVKSYQPATPYPEGNPLTPPLMTVAQAIKAGLGLRVATVDVPG